MSADTSVKALSEIRRQQVISMKLNPYTKDIYSDAFVYAITRRIYPLMEEQIGFLEDHEEILNILPFHDTYKVSREVVEQIRELLDTAWLAKEKITFYAVETPYSLQGLPWPGYQVRMDLIDICRYCYLSNMFDRDFWKIFLSDAPTEAGNLDGPFTNEEIIQWAPF